MKLSLFALLFVIFASVSSQEPRPELTVTEDLQAAQLELTIGHEFAELFILQNRDRLSDYLERIERFTVDEFMNAYSEIKITGLDTRAAMDEFVEPSFCKDAIRNRWDLQVERFGTRLSRCLRTTYNYMLQFTNILNELHVESRYYSNVIPNAGVNVLSGIDIFTGSDNLSTYINARFRDLLFLALNRYDEFEEFVSEISVDLDNLLATYTECYRTLPTEFAVQSAADLESIARCYSD